MKCKDGLYHFPSLILDDLSQCLAHKDNSINFGSLHYNFLCNLISNLSYNFFSSEIISTFRNISHQAEYITFILLSIDLPTHLFKFSLKIRYYG